MRTAPDNLDLFSGAAASPPATDDREIRLRRIWQTYGVPVQRQNELISQIGRKAAPGAAVGPFRIPGNIPARDVAERLVTLAEGMTAEIDSRFTDRLSNTPKRRRQADAARLEGKRLQRTQEALRALAALHNSGDVPPVLDGVRSKKAVYDLVRTRIEHNGGYYDAGIDTGEPLLETSAARAMWALLVPQGAEKVQAEEIRRRMGELQFAKIPGYFWTPAAVIAQMVALAGLTDATKGALLEPSAGSGHILDFVRGACPQLSLCSYERHASLQSVLRLKGYIVTGSDFMDAMPPAAPFDFDYVLMNPPFERGQDMDHVRHAFAMLKPCGVLVAVMSPAFQTHGSNRAFAFRAWLDELEHVVVDLPAGSFKESGTGVSARLVRIRRQGSL